MKRMKAIIPLMMVTMVMVSGCDTQNEKSVVVTKAAAKPEIKVQKLDQKGTDKPTVITASEDPLKEGGYTLLKDFKYNVDNDAKEETIAVYTTAEKSSSGEIMWDDGQKWLVLVTDGDKSYKLYDDYVQFGQVYYSVQTKESDKKSHISVIVSATNGIKIVDYVFDKEKAGYMREEGYSSGDIQEHFTSIPSY